VFSRTYFFWGIISLLILQGCVAVQTFPTVARSGDTITLAVGSPDGMTKGNTTAQFISEDPAFPTPVDLTIRAIVKLRPDNTSNLATYDSSVISNIAHYSSHSPWLSVVVIDLPASLPLGTGKIHIQTAGQVFVGDDINNYPVNIDIIDGVGSANPFKHYNGAGFSADGNLAALEPMPQIVVRPPTIDPNWYAAPTYGAAEIKINLPVQKAGGGVVGANPMMVIQDDMFIANNSTQTHMTWSKSGDVITVNFISPTASMNFYQSRFSVVLNPENEIVPGATPALVSVTYYDANGNIVTLDSPTEADYSIGIE